MDGLKVNRFGRTYRTGVALPLVQSTQLSGKLSHLKSKRARKNVHASRLNANGSNAGA